MQGGWFTGRLSDLSLIGVVLMMLVSTLSAAFLGNGVRRLRLRLAPVSEAGERYQESYLVGSMLGLLALLLAFSFAMGIDRYEERRRLVVQEASAIGTSPETILTPLYGFLVMTAGVLGFVLEERRAWLGAFALFVLLSLYVSIIADLNRPASGNIPESQEPMLTLRQSLKNQPPQTFDRFKTVGLSRQ